MRIPLPCKFGETFGYKGKSLKLLSVSWFKWSYKGLEFTYTTDKEFVTSTDMNQPEYMEIPDEMIKSCQIKGLGYPLKGIGYVAGIQFREGRLFADIIVESRYLNIFFASVMEMGNIRRMVKFNFHRFQVLKRMRNERQRS